MPVSISEAEIKIYLKDGALLIKNLLTPEEVLDLREKINLNIAHPSPRAKITIKERDSGWFFEDFCNWQENLSYQRINFESSISGVAAKLIRSEQDRLFHDQMLVKKSGTKQKTPWQHDQPYCNIEGMQNISFWIPVDPVPLEWTLELVAGSHHGPWYIPRTFLKKEAKWFPEGSLSVSPEIEGNPGNYNVISWELELGDAVAFHMLTLNTEAGSGALRCVFSVRLIGDDIRHVPRDWETSPEFQGLSYQLPAGDPMDHELFPIIWPPSVA